MGIGVHLYLRRRRFDPYDVLYRLPKDAVAVVTDDYPAFIAAHHNACVRQKLDTAYNAVDSRCVVPMSCFEKREYAAYTIRPKIRELIPEHVRASPSSRMDTRSVNLKAWLMRRSVCV